MEYPGTVGLLQALGVGELEERLHSFVLDHPNWPVAEISRAVGVSQRQADRALAWLEAKGLVSRSAGRPAGFLPAPPQAAVGVLILRRQEELERVRVATAALEQRFRRSRELGMADLVEVVTGSEAIAQRFRQLRAAVTEELLFFDKPPYALSHTESVSGELELLQRDVRVLSLYEHSLFEAPEELTAVEELVTVGEEARVISDLPTKLVICDRRVAMLPLNSERPDVDTAVVVHESSLLKALSLLFDRLWDDATALSMRGSAEAGSAVSGLDARILPLLAAGLSEKLIAQQLKVSSRTVGRRVEEMMARFHVRTRFQLAVQACRRGWIQ